MAQFFATDLVSAYANHLYHPDWTTDVDADARNRYEGGQTPGTTNLDIENNVNIPGAGSGDVWRYATHAFLFDEFGVDKVLDGTVTVEFRVSDEGGASDDRFSGGWAVFRVLASDGSVVHSPTFDLQREILEDGGDRRISISQTFSSVSVSEGDLLVVEVGTYHRNSNAASSSASVPTKLWFNSTDTIDIAVPDDWFNIIPVATATGGAVAPQIDRDQFLSVPAGTSTASAPVPEAGIAKGHYKDTVLNDNPVLYWRFEESSGSTVADEVGTRDLDLFGPTLGAESLGINLSNSVSFDGVDDYADTAGSGAFVTGSQNRSVEFWIKSDTDTSTGLISWGDEYGGGVGVRYTIRLDNRRPRVEVNNGYLVADHQMTTGEAHHIVCVFDGTDVLDHVFYVDGELVTSTFASASRAIDTGTREPWLASRWISGSGFDNFWPGILDEIAVYDYALTATQVAEHYEAAFETPVPSGRASGSAVAPEVSTSPTIAAPVGTATGAAVAPAEVGQVVNAGVPIGTASDAALAPSVTTTSNPEVQPPAGTANGSGIAPLVEATGAKIAIIGDTGLGEVPKTRDLFIDLGYDVTLVNDDDVGTHDFSNYALIVTTRNDDSATAVAELDNIWQTEGIPFLISTMDRNVSSGSLAVEALEEMGLATGPFFYTGNSGDATSFVRNVDHPIVDEFGSRTFDIIDDGTANPDTWMVYYNDTDVTTIATTVIANNGDVLDDTKKSTFAVEEGTTDLHARPTPSRVVVTDTLYGGGPGEEYSVDASDWFEALVNWLLTEPEFNASVAAVSGTASSSANVPTISITSEASAPDGTSTGTANAPTVSTDIDVFAPAGTSNAAANAPTVSAGVEVNAPTATSTGTALEPTASLGAGVDAVTGTASGSAIAPTALAEFHIDAVVPVGTASSTAPAPSLSTGIDVAAPVSAATGQALAPTATEHISVNAVVGTASGSAVSPSVTVTTNVTASAPNGTASGLAHAPTTVIDYVVTAPVATGAGSALLPSINVDVAVPVATGSGSTVAPTVQTAVDAVIPTGDATGEGHSPSIRADVAAQIPLASGQGGATLPTITPVTNASVASTGADGQALAPTVAVVRNYDLDIPTATGVGEAKAPAIEISRDIDAPSGTATSAGVAPEASTDVEVAIPTADAQAEAQIPILPHRNVRVTVGTAQGRALTPLHVDELPDSQVSASTAGNEERLSTHDNKAIMTLSDSNASLTSGGNRAVLVLTTE